MSFNDKSHQEKHRRCLISLWAFAYEIKSESLVPDHVFDKACREIDTSIETGNARIDQWFKDNFDPNTAMWIHRHPELKRIEKIYESVKK